jgi:hypothetical protein
MGLSELLQKLQSGGVFIDVKSAYVADEIESQGFALWRL